MPRFARHDDIDILGATIESRRDDSDLVIIVEMENEEFELPRGLNLIVDVFQAQTVSS
jgi:hypothetical protein